MPVTPAKRRQRRQRTHAVTSGGEQVAGAPASAPAVVTGVVPMPEWKWRTFPVFFALSLGLLIGTVAGALSGYVAGDSGDQTWLNVTYIIAAIMMGLGLSRFMTRFMMSRQWIKPRPAAKKRR